MGTHYTALIYDDFDWEYANGDKEHHKQELIEKLSEFCPLVKLKAEWYGYMVFDLYRRHPETEEIKEILLDQDLIYYYSCQDPILKKLERK